MQIRQLRIVPAAPAPDAQPAASGARATPQGPLDFRMEKDPELTNHQYAIFLLQTAADIEHSLMVQYLFAAYSLPPDVKVPGAKDPKTGKDVTTTKWARDIAKIAREEMGHLLSVQLLLRALGGPLSFEREHFPYRSQLYPFPFELEPLTKTSLAKYVYAEMPAKIAPSVLSPEKQREILERATTSSGGVGPNHVGLLYDKLIEVVGNLPDEAFRSVLAAWQPEPPKWSADEEASVEGVKVLPIRLPLSVAEIPPPTTLKGVALRALGIIARQGEAITPSTMRGGMAAEGMNAAQLDGSHFWRFLQIYQQFPDDFFPARPVARNPNTTSAPDLFPMDPAGLLHEQHLRPGRIENATTLSWAHLFNVRYRILLTYLAHYLALPPAGKDAKETKVIVEERDQLLTWIFDEMSLRGNSSLRDLAMELAGLDLDKDPKSGRKAGAPFEAPFTFALPDLGPDRWRVHKDLYEASKDLVSRIPGQAADPILKELTEYEDGTAQAAGRIKFINDHIDSPY